MTVLQERIGLAVAVVVVLAAVNANSLIALIRPLPEQSYTGIFTNEEDIYSYFTKMRVGSEGQLLLDNRYAVEAHRQVPFYLIYTTFGWFIEKLSPVTPVPFDHLVSSYHGLRVVAGAAYLLVLYRVMVLFFAEPAKRGAAWALAVIGGGLGGITTAATGDILFAGGALDLLIGEFTSLRPLVALPHVLIGRTLLLTGVIALVEAVEARRFPAAAILAWTGMTLTMPLYLAPAGGIVGAWIVVRLIADRRIAWEIVWRGLAAGAPGMLFAGLTLILSAQDPVISAWMEQNQIKPAGLPGLMLAVGVQVAAAVAGWIIVLRRKPERWALLIGWAVVPFVLIWIPYNVSLRLIEAYFVPLAILMVIGLAELIEKQRIAGIAEVLVTVL
ncbi:MAG: hypothetical protein GYB64_20545, partial [Chloroflexi bacterium]|nr:hypothetical protein [Chloroflexota bacterium]